MKEDFEDISTKKRDYGEKETILHCKKTQFHTSDLMFTLFRLTLYSYL